MDVSDAVGAIIAPKVLKGFRLSWILYGAAVYFGVKYLYKRGILPEQTGAALGAMDKGIDFAKSQLGIKKVSTFEPNEKLTLQ